MAVRRVDKTLAGKLDLPVTEEQKKEYKILFDKIDICHISQF